MPSKNLFLVQLEMILEIGFWKSEQWWNMVATEQEAKREDVIVLKPWYEKCVKLIYSMTLYNDNLLVGRNVEHFVKVKMNLTLLLLCFLCKL